MEGEVMGNKMRKQAEELGFMEFPMTVLYTRPRNLRPTFATTICDNVDVIRAYLKQLDPAFSQDRSGGSRNTTHYFLAPQLKVYVELVSKTVGQVIYNPANHVNEIKVYSKFKAHVINIVSRLDEIFPDGMLRHMDWTKIENTFMALKEEAIQTWKTYLADRPERERPTDQEIQKVEAEQKEVDDELVVKEFDEEDQAKKFRKVYDKYRD
jgi:hypothetical protein